MEIQNLEQENFLDIFSTTQPNSTDPKPAAFTADNPLDTNILNNKEEGVIELDENGQPKNQTTTPELDENGNPKDINILDDPNKARPGRKSKYDFSDMSGYFEDRIKNKKFVAIEEEGDNGEKKIFIPKTPEEFDEVFDMQINYKLEQSRQENDKKWYESKSPAWKAVAQYAEMVDDPTELLPFLQGVQTIESVSKINEEDIDGAERIVRIRMNQNGDTEDVIEEQIEALKTTDKLISAAKRFKPIILDQENKQLAYMAQERKVQEQQYNQMVHEIRTKALEAIEAPILGKQKLKQDEKAIIYDLIAQPTPDSNGYGIYNEIDKLFQNGDFETLKQVALLVAKKDAFLGYISTGAANKTAETLQGKLRIAAEGRASTSNNFADDEDQPVIIQRNQYGKTRFGR